MHLVAIITTGATFMASLRAVQGHGNIVDPAAQWVDGYPSNGYGSTVDNEIWGVYDNSKFGYGPGATAKFFKHSFPSSGYKSIGALIAENQELYSNKTDPDCGLTVYKDSARSELPEGELTYSGFTHAGPCEVWCDNTKVLFDYDCQSKYPDIPAKMPYDESKCANANRLTIYWMGLHGDPWQVYTSCVWLKGGSGKGTAPSPVGKGSSTIAGSGSASPTPKTNKAPSKATQETAGEAETSVDETQDIDEEIEEMDTPTVSPTSANCRRRRK